MPPQTLHVSAVRSLLSMGATLGIPRSQLLEAAGLTEAQVADAETRLTYNGMHRLWQLLVSVGQGLPLGLRMAESVEPTHMGLVGYVLVNSPDLRTALRRHCVVCSLLDPWLEWKALPTPSGIRLEMRVASWASELKHPPEGLLATVVAVSRMLTGTDQGPRRTCFMHAPHAGSAQVEAFFGGLVEYGTTAYALELDEEYLSLPIHFADVELGNLLHARAEEKLARSEELERRSWHERVRDVLQSQPRLGELGPAEVAARLAVSERTLQRRLKEEEASFAHLEDEVRRERSFQLLRDGKLALFEVAFLLGFSEPSAFIRAFRRWTGKTPRDWQGYLVAGSSGA